MYVYWYVLMWSVWNVTRDTIPVTVDDVLPPVVIGQDVFVTLIDSNVVTWVYANSFNGGSHDNGGSLGHCLLLLQKEFGPS